MTNTINPPVPDRFVRQRDLLPMESIRSVSVTVIGVGAIGRQVAIQLAAIGCGRIQLIDFDSVELHNVASQGFTVRDIGKAKVEATTLAIGLFDDSIKVERVCDHYRSRQCRT